MNKKILKKVLIIIGIILLGVDFIICFKDSEMIFNALINMGFETLDNFGGLVSILTILGLIFLCFGLIIKKEETENSIKMYKVLRLIGYLPFIGILCIGIYYSIYGYAHFSKVSAPIYSYGFIAFIETIIQYSLGLWPFYIIGIFLIKTSSSKINALKND